ncbi:hemolysin D [Amphritea atlantica]|uniref:Hemolysin D n=1 Tax=Amphritea atlantica TaxID=355243 RepID=A0A1H9H5I0_9GAMM|nr:hypothetical protein [Amphritea atlantica]SEQ57497.1 hemolysin D [Amphritea atlantica]
MINTVVEANLKLADIVNNDLLTKAQKEVNLVPGMSVSAEVKTGKRYLIEHILTPLLRYKNESVRER